MYHVCLGAWHRTWVQNGEGPKPLCYTYLVFTLWQRKKKHFLDWHHVEGIILCYGLHTSILVNLGCNRVFWSLPVVHERGQI